MLLQIEGGVCAPRGFRAGGICAGILPENSHMDLSMVASDLPAVCAGVYTKNAFSAAPVRWSSFITSQYNTAQVILLNSGVANALTGDAGYADTVQTVAQVAKTISVSQEAVLTASCGIAGKPLPADVICEGVPRLVPLLGSDEKTGHAAAEAFADTAFSEISVEFELGEKKIRIGAMCSSGEAVLAVFTTDAVIEKESLSQALQSCVEESFSMLGRIPSANDSVLMLANGMAGNKRITEEDESAYTMFCTALSHVAVLLSKRIAENRQGAGGLLEVSVTNAAQKADAAFLAKSLATVASLQALTLVPVSVLYAVGAHTIHFDPTLTDITYKSSQGSLQVIRNGIASYDTESLCGVLSASPVSITIDLKNGNEAATAWGTLLLPVIENNSYTEA